MDIRFVSFPSPVGALTLAAGPTAMHAIQFAGRPTPADWIEGETPLLARAAGQLREYFEGQRTLFDLPLAPRGTPFQVAAWMALRTIPFGQTRSYGEQAALLGRPTATRAVGAANGKNPLPIVLPCHRVIGANGALTGFGGGIEVKRWLLGHEATSHFRLR